MNCPCCGQPVATDRNPAAILATVRFTPSERRIVDQLARNIGRWQNVKLLTEAVYFDDPNGGPEYADRSISVRLVYIRRKLVGTGLTVEGRSSSGHRMLWAEQAMVAA